MAVEIVEFLMAKFVDGLLDGLREGDHATLPFQLHFQEIKTSLENKLSSGKLLGTTANSLRESLYTLNDILSECQMHRDGMRGKFTTSCYSLHESWFLYKMRKRLRMTKQKIQSISTGGPEQPNSSPRSDIQAAEFDRWTTQTVDSTKVHGFNAQVTELEMTMLAEQDSNKAFKGIGIVGMGGVGKTRIAQLLFNSLRVRTHFFPKLWVCISQTAINRGEDVRRDILERMLMSLGVEEEVTAGFNIAELMLTLHLQLLGKRYLIVFDDVWNIDEWYESLGSERLPGDDEWADRLAYGLPKGSGGIAIVTSRLEKVVVQMVGEENLYQLQPLNNDEESCWAIFMEAFAGGEDPAVTGMKTEILDNCGGLPLAAKTIGEIMYGSLSSSSRDSSNSDAARSNNDTFSDVIE